jgi:hypothetical protein
MHTVDTLTFVMVYMIIALGAGLFGGFYGARAEHWGLVRRLETIDGFLRGLNARAAKTATKERVEEILRESKTGGRSGRLGPDYVPLPLPMREGEL